MLSVLSVPPGTALSVSAAKTLIYTPQSQSIVQNTMWSSTLTTECNLRSGKLNAPAQRVMACDVMLT